MRARAVKALASVVDAEPGVLGLPEVAAGLSGALGDEAVSVREAALDLLGRHMAGGDVGLAEAYFELLAGASQVGAAWGCICVWVGGGLSGHHKAGLMEDWHRCPVDELLAPAEPGGLCFV